ncbi:MAG: hypothetical protein AB7I59_28015 [Geminicoccaceae bacterium]
MYRDADINASYLRATVQIRETAKWLVGGIAAAAAGVLIGSPLTNFGTLEPAEKRFWIAILGVSIGFLAMGYIVSICMDIVIPKYLREKDFLTGGRIPGRIRSRIERALQEDLPFEKSSIEEVFRRVDYIFDKKDPGTNNANDVKSINRDLIWYYNNYNNFYSRLLLEEVIGRLEELRVRGAFAALIMFVGYGTFAWAANPPIEKEVLDGLRRSRIYVHPDDRALLGKIFGDMRCVNDYQEVLAVSVSDEVVLDAIFIPNRSDCKVPRLKIVKGRLFE